MRLDNSMREMREVDTVKIVPLGGLSLSRLLSSQPHFATRASLDFDRDEHGDITAHQVAEVTVHAESGSAPILRLVYVSTSQASGVASLQVALTPLQSIRLARDLLSIAEHELRRRFEQGPPLSEEAVSDPQGAPSGVPLPVPPDSSNQGAPGGARRRSSP